MTTKRWISLAIVAVMVIGGLGLIKVFPFWVTLVGLVDFAVGFVAGYLFKKPEIITEIKEVIKEVPAKKRTVKINKKTE